MVSCQAACVHYSARTKPCESLSATIKLHSFYFVFLRKAFSWKCKITNRRRSSVHLRFCWKRPSSTSSLSSSTSCAAVSWYVSRTNDELLINCTLETASVLFCGNTVTPMCYHKPLRNPLLELKPTTFFKFLDLLFGVNSVRFYCFKILIVYLWPPLSRLSKSHSNKLWALTWQQDHCSLKVNLIQDTWPSGSW